MPTFFPIDERAHPANAPAAPAAELTNVAWPPPGDVTGNSIGGSSPVSAESGYNDVNFPPELFNVGQGVCGLPLSLHDLRVS